MNLQKFIDHTLLKPMASIQEIENLCNEAIQYQFAAVCINPLYIAEAKNFLNKGHHEVKICTVIGFPLGASTKETKIFETIDAIKKGAQEIDLVISLGALKSGHDKFVGDEIKEIISAAKSQNQNIIVKAILEISLLEGEAEKIRAIQIASGAGVDFIKTSTGFNNSKATLEDVALMAKYKLPQTKIKASGGIKTKAEALKFIELGVSRIGTSSGISIVS